MSEIQTNLSHTKQIGDTSKYHIGSVWGGCTILSTDRYEKYGTVYIKEISLSCGYCGVTFELNYPLFTAMTNHAKEISCGCVSCESDNHNPVKTKLQKDIEKKALHTEVKYLKSMLRKNTANQISTLRKHLLTAERKYDTMITQKIAEATFNLEFELSKLKKNNTIDYTKRGTIHYEGH